MATHYEILGVNPDAGWEIARATGLNIEPSRASAGATAQPAGDLRVDVHLERP